MRNKAGRIVRAGKAGKAPRKPAVTASRFREARAVCCLTVPGAAKLLRVTERTIQNWESGAVRVPYAAYKLMRVLRGHELPHAAWAGFRVVGDSLWTPEGYRFRPGDMAWWSLTCRMAAEFRTLAAARAGAGEAGSRAVALGLVHSKTSDTPDPDSQQIRGSQAHLEPSLDRPQPGSQPPASARRLPRHLVRPHPRRHPGATPRAAPHPVRLAPTSDLAANPGGAR